MGIVDITTLTNRQYCVILDPVGEDGKPQLGQKKLIKVFTFRQRNFRARVSVNDFPPKMLGVKQLRHLVCCDVICKG
jgi:hypothetical protein